EILAQLPPADRSACRVARGVDGASRRVSQRCQWTRLDNACRLSWKVIHVTKRCNSTLLWTALDGVQCRMAAYGEDQCQVMLQWHEETIRTTVVSGYADALSTSQRWRQEWDTRASATGIL